MRRFFGLKTHLPKIEVKKVLTSDVLNDFSNDGAVCLRQALSHDWIDALRIAAEENLVNPGPLCDEHAAASKTPGRFHDDQFLWLRHETFKQFVLASGAGTLAAEAMGSKSAHIFYDQLLVKEPGTASPTPWHNDTSYWHLAGRQICSLWVALDEVPSSTGVAYVKGSHKWSLRHPITNFSGDYTSEKNLYEGLRGDALTVVPDVETKVEKGEYELLRWDMKPGDVILFDSASLHGAPGNFRATRRRGYATRWCGDDVTYDDRPGTMAFGWRAAGFDAGLAHGSSISCALHPNVL